MISSIYSSLDTWAASQAVNAQSAAALRQIYDKQTDLIVNQNGMGTTYYRKRGTKHLLKSSSYS